MRRSNAGQTHRSRSSNLRPASSAGNSAHRLSGSGSTGGNVSVNTPSSYSGRGGGDGRVDTGTPTSITANNNTQSIGNLLTHRDHSVTHAVIDDDNCSALQQITKGGGAITLASQWKSQFDDSEDTTDNEWKQEPQSPEHFNKSMPILRMSSLQNIPQHHKQQSHKSHHKEYRISQNADERHMKSQKKKIKYVEIIFFKLYRIDNDQLFVNF